MRLPYQALIAALGVACLGLGGCGRLLEALFTPQKAISSAAENAANTATAPTRSDLAGVNSEVERLLVGQNGNSGELSRIKKEIEQRIQDRSLGTSAQANTDRLRPWHPRPPPEIPPLGRTPPGDEMGLGLAETERGLAASGPLPDGTAPAELMRPLNLSRVRLGPKR